MERVEGVKLIDKSENVVKYKDGTLDAFPGKVLTRGLLSLPPLGTINHFLYSKTLLKGINSIGLVEFNSLQKSVVPYFLSGDDCFIFGGGGSGKTLSYLMPMVGKLVEEEVPRVKRSGGENLTMLEIARIQGRGPSAIIMCSDKRSAVKIEGHLFQILQESNQRQISYCVLCETHDFKQLRFNREYDIIVTSVAFFANQLEKSLDWIGFEKLRYFVFEDVDISMQAYKKDCDYVNDVLTSIAAKHSRFSIQRVFCGRDWCPEVEDSYMKLPCLDGNGKQQCVPTVFINSMNFSIKYSEMKWFIHHCISDQEKMNKLKSLLRSLEGFKHRSIFVFCSTPEVAKSVYEEFEDSAMNVRLAETKNMNRAVFNQRRHEWENSSDERTIMILNDDITSLNIHNVTCLIHYDVPPKKTYKSSTVTDRFSCMWSNIRNIAKEKNDPSYKYQRPELEAHFLLTGKENELYRLTNFAKKMNCTIPASISVIADELGKEITKKLPMCQGIEWFGRCMEPTATSCRARHSFLLAEVEAQPVVPRSGVIQVTIAECINPSVYTARVMRYYEHVNGKQVLKYQSIQAFNKICSQLKAYYEDVKNKIPPSSFQVGTLAALENFEGIFRVRILEIRTRTDSHYPKQLRVFGIDTGNYLNPLAEQLFMLPEQFEILPQLAIKLILGNLQPMDGSSSYGSTAISKAQTKTIDKILNGRVQFSMGETVWVNPLVDFGRDEESDMKSRSSVRLDLIREKCAENNDSHLNNIITLCRDTGFVCAELEDQDNPIKDPQFMSKFVDLGDEYRWAFVQSSKAEKPDPFEVLTSFTKDPHCIFGKNAKFEKQLTVLEEELNDAIEKLIEEKCSKYETQFASLYQKGLVVALKDKWDGMWHRGLILDVLEEDSGRSYNVFFVDIGDQQNSTTKELFPMPRFFLTKLPFQAISFQLSHIRLLDGENSWNDFAILTLMELTLDKDDGDAPFLLDVVALKEGSNSALPCRQYSAVILAPSTSEDIGVTLVQKGCAKFVENGEEMVQLVKKKMIEKVNILYDKQNAEMNSEESDDEDNVVDHSGINEDEGSEIEGFDVVGFNLNEFAKKLGIDALNDDESKKSLEQKKHDVPVPVIATPTLERNGSTVTGFSSLKHPEVHWKQTTTEFILRVEHPDIKVYTIDVEKKVISFRTIDPPDYGFDLELFGAVHKEPKEFLTGQCLKITLKKRTVWLWSRATTEKVKLRWLKEVSDHDNVSSDDEGEVNRHHSTGNPDFDEDAQEEDTDSADSEVDEDRFF